MPTAPLHYEEYLKTTRKAADFQNAAAVLSWDQETYMPPKGFAARGRQIATLAAAAHELLTAPAYADTLAALRDAPKLTADQQMNVQRSLEDLEKSARLSPEFVEALSLQSTACFEAWLQAREANDFSVFRPVLEKMVSLKKEQAALYGGGSHPYDALLDDYEKGATVAWLDGVFEDLKGRLQPLLQRIGQAQPVSDQLFSQDYESKEQFAFTEELLRAMGYDFEAGRQDYSEHPFSISFSPEDARITTRVDPKNIAFILWSSIHEGGHALYEQGLPVTQYGLPLGAAASLSIHESQSRLWENSVGRGLPFWKHFFPRLQARFPEQLRAFQVEDWFRAANKVQPSFIRTEADELTYHFHVIIRYELEKQLMAGTLEVADLEAAWNEAYRQNLGITPPDARQGVLQDVHWSHGSFGYFPTYTLGSLYAAQFYEKALSDIPELEAGFEKGDFRKLLDWLRIHIHQQGRRYLSDDLCREVTGQGLSAAHFLRALTEKLRRVYPDAFEALPSVR